MDEAFGSSRKIRNSVVMKCTNGIPEKVSHDCQILPGSI